MSGIQDTLKKGAATSPSSPPAVDAAEGHHNHHRHHHQQPPIPLLLLEIFQSTTFLSTSPLLVATVSILIYCLEFPTHDERTNRALVLSWCDPHRNLE